MVCFAVCERSCCCFGLACWSFISSDCEFLINSHINGTVDLYVDIIRCIFKKISGWFCGFVWNRELFIGSELLLLNTSSLARCDFDLIVQEYLHLIWSSFIIPAVTQEQAIMERGSILSSTPGWWVSGRQVGREHLVDGSGGSSHIQSVNWNGKVTCHWDDRRKIFEDRILVFAKIWKRNKEEQIV